MTDDDRAVRLLRETLAERAGTLDGAPPVLTARPVTARRRRAPLLAVAAAALVAVGAVTGVAAWRAHRPGAAAPVSAVGNPAGWKPVAALGVEIQVPASWVVTGAVNPCLVREIGDHVVSRPVGGVSYVGCITQKFTGVTLVEFRPSVAQLVPGRTSLPTGFTQITWISPDRSAAVVASGPDGDLLQQVIDTARAVDVDGYGCPSVGSRPSWDHPRPGLAQIPGPLVGTMSDVVGCVYADDLGAPGYRLVASGRFDARDRDALSAALRRAPAGTAPDVPQNCLPGLQEDAYAVLHVRTGSGVTPMTLHWENCVGRYAATYGEQSAMTVRLLTTLMDALHVEFVHQQLPQG